MANRLSHESSAYLLQHKDNPVDWCAWGTEPFERARRERKPVLVSIGYSSCHWCHVMERESFEDPETASLMNEHLVAIKVDREERPDVDQIYMNAVTRMTGSGGWPLNVFCTPDGRPFFGGTYFPPEPAHGRASWRQVVEAIAEAFAEKSDQVEEQAARVLEALAARPELAPAELGRQTLGAFCQELMARADPAHGGFGPAPKFPTPVNLEAVLCAARHRVAQTGALEHVTLTLRRMARGGIYDQLAGGFHRYSTDARWLVPHFEKMLYDQGQLLRVYAEAFRQTGDSELAWPVAETVEFLEREMRAPDGGFYASLDADSQGEEGRFYVWTPAELAEVLGARDAEVFAQAYGVEPGGTFEHTGASVLAHGMAGERPRMAPLRAKLLEARANRPRPDTDHKHVTAWLGYAIGGLATAGAVFERSEWVASAARAADFVLERMTGAGGELYRIWDGEARKVPGFLDDHAALLNGLLDLHRAGGADGYLDAALRLAEAIRDRFFDPEVRALYFAPSDGERLVLRPESDTDGATPAAAGHAVLGLARLAELADRDDLREVARAGIERDSPLATAQPIAFPTLLRAATLLDQGMGVAIVLGPPGDTETLALARRARQLLAADDAVVVLEPGARPDWLGRGWLEDRDTVQGRPTAYLCRGAVCSLPATNPDALALPPSA